MDLTPDAGTSPETLPALPQQGGNTNAGPAIPRSASGRDPDGGVNGGPPPPPPIDITVGPVTTTPKPPTPAPTPTFADATHPGPTDAAGRSARPTGASGLAMQEDCMATDGLTRPETEVDAWLRFNALEFIPKRAHSLLAAYDYDPVAVFAAGPEGWRDCCPELTAKHHESTPSPQHT